MDELMLDGNAVAGLLQEVFAVEMTTSLGTCGACGACEEMGAAHVFRGAGVVLRCPHCHNTLMTIVTDEGLADATVPRSALTRCLTALRSTWPPACPAPACLGGVTRGA